MVYTSLRIRREDKAALERLQQTWQRARGETPSQIELFERLVAFAETHGDLFMAEASPGPWSEAAIDGWIAGLPRPGPEPEGDQWHNDMDRAIYGDPHGEGRDATRP